MWEGAALLLEDSMKTGSIALISATAFCSLAIASASSAQDYGYSRYRDGCTDRIHSNGTTGTILGGLAGAAVGANLAAHHGGRAGGALLGAAAGAAVGNNIARSSTKSNCRGSQYGYRSSYYPYRRSARYDRYAEPPYDSYGYQPPYYARPSAFGYYGYGDEGSGYDPRHYSRHHKRHDHDDDDDDGGDH